MIKKSSLFMMRIVLCLVILSMLLSACDGSDTDTANENEPTAQVSETVASEDATQDIAEPDAAETQKVEAPAQGDAEQEASTKEAPSAAPTRAPVTKDGDTWLVMLYQDADDQTLEEDIFTDLNEAEKVGSTDKVSIVAQIDRYGEGFEGEQDFSGAKRFYLTQDDDLNIINSEELDDLGEVNMADGQTLVDFATWAIGAYPADHYVLILSDHGTGWPGGWTDGDVESDPKNVRIDGFDDMLYLNELDDALTRVEDQTGIGRLDMIGFDACLMGSLEVLDTMAPHAQYAVVSQETEPSMGWAYTAFLEKLTADPKQDSATLAKTIVESYIVEDTMIVDDEARARYLESNYDDNSISQAALAKEESKTVTLAAIDLNALTAVNSAVDHLAQVASQIDPKTVAAARAHARAFESVFGDDYPSPYIDLGNFAALLANEDSSKTVENAVAQVDEAIQQAVIAEKHGSSKKGSTGISIYFPNSKLFEESGSDYETYVNIADRFAAQSLWDNFLYSYYTGEPLKASASPEPEATVVAPAKAEISVDPIELSKETASKGKPVTLSTVVKGDNVAYIYLFTGRVSKDGNQLQIIDIDYIDADNTKEADGVVYPDWGEGEIPIDIDWEPVRYAVSDGKTSVPALLEPDTYGAELEDTIYKVDGMYHFVDGEPDRYARLFFSGEGDLISVMTFSGAEDSGPMHEVTPQKGDQVTLLDRWLSLGDEESTATKKEAGTLTFGKKTWSWDEKTALKGDYVVGIIAEDIDGNTYEEYVPVTAK